MYRKVDWLTLYTTKILIFFDFCLESLCFSLFFSTGKLRKKKIEHGIFVYLIKFD